MTLKEWCEGKGIEIPKTINHAVPIHTDPNTYMVNYWTLWHLDDYRVECVSGPVIWLAPKE